MDEEPSARRVCLVLRGYCGISSFFARLFLQAIFRAFVWGRVVLVSGLYRCLGLRGLRGVGQGRSNIARGSSSWRGAWAKRADEMQAWIAPPTGLRFRFRAQITFIHHLDAHSDVPDTHLIKSSTVKPSATSLISQHFMVVTRRVP